MRIINLAIGCFAAMAISSAATAQTRTCTTEGVRSDLNIPYEANSPAFMAALILTSVLLPEEEGAKVSRDITCTRGEAFNLGNQKYLLTGENTDAYPRRIVPENGRGVIFYLAPLTTSPARGEASPTPAKYALLSVGQAGSAVWRLYKDVPIDEILRIDVSTLVTTGAQPYAAMKRGTKQLDIISSAAVTDQAPARSSQMTAPDGVVFVKDGEDGAKHALTGFVCPPIVAEVARRDLVIYQPRGEDVSCGYGVAGPRTWFTVYLTKIPGATHRQIFDAYVQSARTASPASRNIRSPLETGREPKPTSAAFWQAGARVEGLTLSSIGDWRIKVRISYTPGDEALVERLVTAVYEQAYAQVR